MNNKILTTHLERRAAVYLRQSTLKQVHEHRESTARQYSLRERAVALGWTAEHVDVIDDDLGQSGTSTHERDGFQRLAEDVAHGRVGAIFAIEVSRLARSSADWHHLLDLCGLADVVIVDEQAIYTPRDYNDRLLLGLKGTMSEAELYWMRLRLHGGQISKARRGEYAFVPPAGYEWDSATSHFRMDPDENVQRAVSLVFERFRVDGTARRVAQYLVRHGLQLPVRSPAERTLRWGPASAGLVQSMLHNPIYAGAYAYGRHEHRLGLVDGQKRRRSTKLPQPAWKVCLRDRHPGYISWDEFMANEEKLHQNRTNPTAHQRGAARDGSALLQGLVLCGRCGHRMHVEYCGNGQRAVYQCQRDLEGTCYVVPAKAVDEFVAQLFLATVKPPEIEIGLAVVREAERQAGDVDRQWKLRLERAEYEARLAERRYKAIDPDNRVVARTLEREWNDKLVVIEQVEREREAVRRREHLELTDADRRRILDLARNLSVVWNAPTTTHADRKNILRMLVREVTLSRVDVPRAMTRVQLLWQTGAVSDFTIDRKDKYTARRTPPAAVMFIRESFDHQPDGWIAAVLNRRGLRTGADMPWSSNAVRRVRYEHELFRSSPKSRRASAEDTAGLSAHAVAVRVGVKHTTVLHWLRTGVLKATRQRGAGRPYRFQLDEVSLARLRSEKDKMEARRSPSSATAKPATSR
jgi:DNA invertase Pin-like site-specific DNA recombinase